MKLKPVNPTGKSYSQAVDLSDFKRIVFVSGQVPEDERTSTVPEDFADQCRMVWSNVEKQLTMCDMKLSDIVKVTTYLSDRKYRESNSKVRQEILGPHSPALTVIIAGIYEEVWHLEIEVIAAQ